MSTRGRIRRLERETRPQGALAIRVVIADPDSPAREPGPDEIVIRIGGDEGTKATGHGAVRPSPCAPR